MLTIFLVAVGIPVLVFLLALRGSGNGQEDRAGFHPALRPVFRSPQAITGSTTWTRPTRPTRANPWRQLPLHGQDEIDLLMACAVSRASLVSDFWVEWAVPPVLAASDRLPRTPSTWIKRTR